MERPIVAYLFGDMEMSPSVQKPRHVSVTPPAGTHSWTSGNESSNGCSDPSQLDTWREAVGLWLDWNSAYEHVTEQLFALGHDQRRLEEVMDQMDQIRRRAICLSRQLID